MFPARYLLAFTLPFTVSMAVPHSPAPPATSQARRQELMGRRGLLSSARPARPLLSEQLSGNPAFMSSQQP